MFPQVYDPGRQCQSDFTHMGSLNVTIEGQKFEHLAYHFVLAYSNWETVTLCSPNRSRACRPDCRMRCGIWGGAGRTSERQPVGGGQQPEGSG